MSFSHTVMIYKDDAGEWRWHREAANGEIVADSGEGYKNLKDCRDMARQVNSEASFVIVDGPGTPVDVTKPGNHPAEARIIQADRRSDV